MKLFPGAPWFRILDVMKRVLILPIAVLLAGCWTLRPGENIELSDRLDTTRESLAGAPELEMELDGLRLVATALPEDSGPLFYYADRWASRDSDLTASEVEAILTLPSEESVEQNLRPLEPKSEEFQNALAFFPELHGYRERSRGYEEPEEKERSNLFSSPFETGALRWEFSYRLEEHNEPLTVFFYFRGNEEDDTRSIQVRLRAPEGGETTVRLNPETLGMKERTDAEVQRLLRAVTWDGKRYALLFDRIVDLDTGEETPLLWRVPSSYVDHIVLSEDRSRAQLIYGEFRITKQTLTVPIRRPGQSP